VKTFVVHEVTFEGHGRSLVMPSLVRLPGLSIKRPEMYATLIFRQKLLKRPWRLIKVI